MASAPKRLVIELTQRAAADLAWLIEMEELNKTNVVNRAIQVYKRVIEAQANGGALVIDDPKRGEPQRVVVI